MTGTKTLKGTILALACALLLACGMTLPAYAAATAATVDLNEKGSISATLKATDDTHPTDGELSLYQVANLELINGNMTYTYTSAFEGCEASLDDITVASLASELDTFVKEHEIEASSTSAISSEGTVSFGDLSVGLYLIAQTTQSSGYFPIDSFLVSIPLDENGIWVYDVDAFPKIELVTPGKPDKPNDNEPGDETPNNNTPVGTTDSPNDTGGTGSTGGLGNGNSTGTTDNTGNNAVSKSGGSSSYPLSQTGDTTPFIPIIAVIVLAVTGATVAGIRLRRRS